jgi:flagellar M-ring protein FliF
VQQLIAVWQTLNTQRRIIVAGATIAVFVAILAISGMASKPSMSLLYAGLEGSQAADVVTSLEQRGAVYEVRGDSIYVEAPRRDELRMLLAGEGLPAAGGQGYELLDSLSGFGTTSQMFDAAYWRAKEGELARTLVASPQVRAARVHIANSTSQPFRKDLKSTASVWVTTANGSLSPGQAKAFKFLIASAVAGMNPEDVSVIDGEGGLMSTGDETASNASAEDRAAELKHNVERLLEARVGYGKAIVEVSVETISEREAITERSFDPASRIAISTDVEERTNKSDDTGSGAVTVASNLPNGTGTEGQKSQSESSETRERTNYEVSETTREILKVPGAIKKISVAVLVDGTQTTDTEGNVTWGNRPQEELDSLKALVASAVGFDEARGDVITLRSMSFEPVAISGTEAVAGMSNIPLDLTSIIQSAVLAAVALVLGLFVLKPLLAKPVSLISQTSAQQLLNPDSDRPQSLPALTGEIDEEPSGPVSPMMIVSDGSNFSMGDVSMPMGMAMGNFDDDDAETDPVGRLKKLIEQRQTESVEILRGWLEDREETV